MSNIGRAIVKKLAVKFEGNEILSVDDFDIIWMLPRLVEDEVRKKKSYKTRHHKTWLYRAVIEIIRCGC